MRGIANSAVQTGASPAPRCFIHHSLVLMFSPHPVSPSAPNTSG